MPRKKKTETAEATEVKTTKKRKSTKGASSVQEFPITEIVNWTDEECAEKDKLFKFTTADVRNIFKSLVVVNDQLSDVAAKFNLLKNTIAKGLMTGYKIECPHCKREYVVSSTELNREGPILCKVCGTEYKENEHITGIEYASDEGKVTII